MSESGEDQPEKPVEPEDTTVIQEGDHREGPAPTEQPVPPERTEAIPFSDVPPEDRIVLDE
jgi:hypothetical protein